MIFEQLGGNNNEIKIPTDLHFLLQSLSPEEDKEGMFFLYNCIPRYWHETWCGSNEVDDLPDLSWAACFCQVAPTPVHLQTEPPANRSSEPPGRTPLPCVWSPAAGQSGTDCGLRCCHLAASRWSASPGEIQEEEKRKKDNVSSSNYSQK